MKTFKSMTELTDHKKITYLIDLPVVNIFTNFLHETVVKEETAKMRMAFEISLN